MPKIKKLILISFFVAMAIPSFGQKGTRTLSPEEKLDIDREDGLDRAFNSFDDAVSRRDTAAIKKMIHFPLRTAKVIEMPCGDQKNAYRIYDATKAGPISKKEWPKYQKIFLSNQAVKYIPNMLIKPSQIDTSAYSDQDPCPVPRKKIMFLIELQKLVDKGSEITFFLPYYPRKGHKEELVREIGFGWIKGKCKIISYVDKIGLPHAE